MLGENIKRLRKDKGYSQEALAQQLHVVRQTISKWEKGISVPDAEMLNRLSEIFEVSVGELLGADIPEKNDSSDISEVAKQLAVLNELLAGQAARRRRIIKRTLIGVFAAVFLLFAAMIFSIILFGTLPQSRNEVIGRTHFECTLGGETYEYEIGYNEHYQIIESGGDEWIADHVQTEQYEDANVLTAQIHDYFEEHGGTCDISTDDQTVDD